MTEKIYMGIDPGLSGGIAIIENTVPLVVMEMMITTNGEIDVIRLRKELRKILRQVDHCYIEKSQPMPQQSANSTFNYGKGYGMIRALLDISAVPYQEIAPLKWKREYSLVNKGKNKPKKKKASIKAESIAVARKLFPKLPDETFITPRGRMKDGVAEALLIAEFCRRTIQ